VLAEMLMGKRLFVGSNEVDVLLMVRDANLDRLEEMGDQIDPDLYKIVHRALCKKNGDRYQSAIEFRNALLEWLFQQRKFVTNTLLANLVESFYASAVAKRKKSLKKGTKSPAESSAAQAQELAEEDEGEEYSIELGNMGPSPEGELGLAAGTQPLSPQVAESADDVDPLDGNLFVPLPDNGVSVASPSISLKAPDPASRDFDDSSIAGFNPRPSSVLLSDVSEPTPPSEPESAVAVSEAESDIASAESESAVADDASGLSETSVLGALIRLTMHRKSGKLIVTQGERRKEAFLKGGDPTAVSSNEPDDLFGAFLVREKCISSGELDMALAVMPRFNGQLGDTLVGLGLMDPLEVFAALTSQIRERLVDVCTWTDGELEWFEEESCPEPAFQLDLDPFEAYGAGAMATPRESIESWLTPRGHVRPAINPTNTFPPELFMVGLGARKYLDCVDGKKTVQDIVDASSQDDEGLYELRILFLLLNAGLLTDLVA
jgi:serine/threonine-protein kinase